MDSWKWNLTYLMLCPSFCHAQMTSLLRQLQKRCRRLPVTLRKSLRLKTPVKQQNQATYLMTPSMLLETELFFISKLLNAGWIVSYETPERLWTESTVDRVFMHLNSYKYWDLFLADIFINKNYSSHILTLFWKSSPYRTVLCTNYYYVL